MMPSKSACSFLSILYILHGSTCLAAEQEIVIGRDANNKLQVLLEFDQPVPLEPSIFPGITGYATGEFGFHSAVFDEPANDFFQVSTAADFRLILVAKDPGMEVWNDTGSAFLATNQPFFLGPAPFDTHPLLNLVSGKPGQTYSLTFIARDLSGIHTDSEPFPVTFTPEPLAGPFRIQLTRTTDGELSLSWSTRALGWELETAAAPEAQAWTIITNTPVVAGSNVVLHLPTRETQQFYRLRRP